MKRAALAVVVLLLVMRRDAHAADPLEDFAEATTSAHDLLTEAHALMERQDYADACPKLEQALRLEADVGARLELAACREHAGELVAAWSAFVAAAAELRAAKQTARAKEATKRARALEPRLPKLVVEVPSPEEGLEVKRNGLVLDTTAWGTAIAVDPGTHRVTATAPGKRRWLMVVQSTEGATTRVRVPDALPEAADAAASVAPAAPVALVTPDILPTPEVVTAGDVGPPVDVVQPRPAVPPRPSLATEQPDVHAVRRTIGWTVAGLGAIGLGVGTGFALSSLGRQRDSRSYCNDDACSATGVSLRDDAIRAGNVATASTIFGMATLVGGLVIVLTTPKRSSSR
jgi:hypothetical protein